MAQQDFGIYHCTTDCGKVLVGAAKLQLQGLVWQGSELAQSFSVQGLRPQSGFTGSSSYLGEKVVAGKWAYNGNSNVTIGSAPSIGADNLPRAPYIGHFFAPDRAGSYQSSYTYSAQTFTGSMSLPIGIVGEGVADGDGISGAQPALTLEVVPNQTNTCAASEPECVLSAASSISFTVTAKYNAANKPQADVPDVEHVRVRLLVEEVNTGCTNSGPSYDEWGNTSNNFAVNDYLHYLNPRGPTEPEDGKTCSRRHSYLASINKPVEYRVSSRHGTGDGYVRYLFFIEGHVDLNNLSKWPGSHKTFKLSSNGVPQLAPVAVIQATALGDRSFRLDGSGSYDSDGSITGYSWQTDYGTQTYTSKTVDLTFPDDNAHVIKLTVTDNAGLTNTAQQTVTRTCSQPVARFTLDPASGMAPLTVALNAGTSSPGGCATRITGYTWASNDGTTIPAGAQQTVTYTTPGTYTITLTVTDDKGATHTLSQQVTVEERPASAAYFTATPLAGVAPMTVQLDGSLSTSPTGQISQFLWYSTDGQNITTLSANGDKGEITFTQPGNYAITLLTLDSDFNGASYSQFIKVVAEQAPIALFTAQTSETSLTVSLDGRESYDPDNWAIDKSKGITTYIWSSSDGQQIEGLAQTSVTFATAGTYTVSLVVVDNEGRRSQALSKSLTVKQLPVASFTLSASEGFKPLTVALNASASYDPDNPASDSTHGIVSYKWTSSTGQVAYSYPQTSVVLSEAGTYTINLEVQDDEGNKVSAEPKTITVWDLPDLGLGIRLPRQTSNTPTVLFEGGVQFLDTRAFLAQDGTLPINREVYIVGQATIPVEHIGKPADVLIVAEYWPNPASGAALYYAKTTTGKWMPTSLNALPIASHVNALGSVLTIPVLQGIFPRFPGNFSIYLAYRLPDGTLFYNGQTIDFQIAP